jgi:hypothetical protein
MPQRICFTLCVRWFEWCDAQERRRQFRDAGRDRKLRHLPATRPYRDEWCDLPERRHQFCGRSEWCAGRSCDRLHVCPMKQRRPQTKHPGHPHTRSRGFFVTCQSRLTQKTKRRRSLHAIFF